VLYNQVALSGRSRSRKLVKQRSFLPAAQPVN
jgi:hypothetical protein